MEVEGRLIVPQLNTAPSSPVEGEVYWDADDDKFYVWNGTTWVDLGATGGVSVSSEPPGSPTEGSVYWDSDDHALYGYDDAADVWVQQGTGKALPFFRAYRNTALSVATGAGIPFDVENDPSALYDTSTGVFSPNRAGWYFLSWQVASSASLAAGVYWEADLYDGAGTQVQQGAWEYGATSAGAGASVGSALVYSDGSGSNANKFHVRVNHNAGGSLALSVGSSQVSRFSGFFVSNDHAGGVNVPKFEAYRTSNGSAIASLASAILYNSERYDQGSWFDPTTGRATAPISGIYHFDVEVTGAGAYATTTALGLRAYINGSAWKFVDHKFGSNNANSDKLKASFDVQLAAGDYLEIRPYISTGSFTAYGEASGHWTYMSGHLISEPAGTIYDPDPWIVAVPPQNHLIGTTAYVAGTIYTPIGAPATVTAGSFGTSGKNVTTTSLQQGLIYIDSTNWKKAGKNLKLALRATVLTGATAPAKTFTFDLYPVTIAASTTVMGTALGASAAVNASSTNSVLSTRGTSITAPASPGLYTIGMTTAAGTPADECNVAIQLEYRNE